ncbi:MAG: extracellular solute-binding protein [bacterium]
MKNVIKNIKESPIWLLTIIISVISIVVFIYLPFQINLSSENTLKKIYYVDNISEAHRKIINKFNAKYKGSIEVVPVNLPFNHFTTNDRKEILTRSLRSRSDGIDVFAVDLIWIPRFAKWGYVMDKRKISSILNNVNPTALKACYQNDSLVAFPHFLDIGVLYYRKDLIRQLPDGEMIERKIQEGLTWDEFISLGKRFNPDENSYYIFTGGNFEGMMCCFYEMVPENESNDVFNNYPINLNTPPIKAGLQRLVDFIHTYNFSPFAVTKLDEYNSYIYSNENNAVFLRGWIGYHKQYKRFLRDTSTAVNMEIAPLPHLKDNITSSVLGGWCLMISKFSNNKEEALKFVDFMFEKENQKILYEDGGVIPTNNEVFEDKVFVSEHPELVQIKKMLAWGKHRPFLENYTRISEIMALYFHKALKKEISVEEAVNSVSKQINSEKAIVK